MTATDTSGAAAHVRKLDLVSETELDRAVRDVLGAEHDGTDGTSSQTIPILGQGPDEAEREARELFLGIGQQALGTDGRHETMIMVRLRLEDGDFAGALVALDEAKDQGRIAPSDWQPLRAGLQGLAVHAMSLPASPASMADRSFADAEPAPEVSPDVSPAEAPPAGPAQNRAGHHPVALLRDERPRRRQGGDPNWKRLLDDLYSLDPVDRRDQNAVRRASRAVVRPARVRTRPSAPGQWFKPLAAAALVTVAALLVWDAFYRKPSTAPPRGLIVEPLPPPAPSDAAVAGPISDPRGAIGVTTTKLEALGRASTAAAPPRTGESRFVSDQGTVIVTDLTGEVEIDLEEVVDVRFELERVVLLLSSGSVVSLERDFIATLPDGWRLRLDYAYERSPEAAQRVIEATEGP
ncbi:MAG: hypothetical protein ACYS22_00155 [Planctomycetota bacterium]|jgi:hypothetical protein